MPESTLSIGVRHDHSSAPLTRSDFGSILSCVLANGAASCGVLCEAFFFGSLPGGPCSQGYFTLLNPFSLCKSSALCGRTGTAETRLSCPSTLDECLRDQRRHAGNDLTGLAKSFQKKLAKVISGPWLLATGDDFRYPETEGGRLKPPTAFFRPGVMRQVLARLIRQRPSKAEAK